MNHQRVIGINRGNANLADAAGRLRLLILLGLRITSFKLRTAPHYIFANWRIILSLFLIKHNIARGGLPDKLPTADCPRPLLSGTQPARGING